MCLQLSKNGFFEQKKKFVFELEGKWSYQSHWFKIYGLNSIIYFMLDNAIKTPTLSKRFTLFVQISKSCEINHVLPSTVWWMYIEDWLKCAQKMILNAAALSEISSDVDTKSLFWPIQTLIMYQKLILQRYRVYC